MRRPFLYSLLLSTIVLSSCARHQHVARGMPAGSGPPVVGAEGYLPATSSEFPGKKSRRTQQSAQAARVPVPPDADISPLQSQREWVQQTEHPVVPPQEAAPAIAMGPSSADRNVTSMGPVRHARRLRAARAVSGGGGRSPASVETGGTADIGEREKAWFDQLGSGDVKYHVESPMEMGTGYTATATIHRPASGVVDAGQDGRELKVSDYMVVTLAADRPDAFKIDPPESVCKFVPEDATVQWPFRVTPQQPGDQRLTFTTYVVYGDSGSACSPDNPDRHPLPSDYETVTVRAIPQPHTLWVRLVEYVYKNPWTSLVWLLPGGAGFAGATKFVKWLLARGKQRNGAGAAAAVVARKP